MCTVGREGDGGSVSEAGIGTGDDGDFPGQVWDVLCREFGLLDEGFPELWVECYVCVWHLFFLYILVVVYLLLVVLVVVDGNKVECVLS